MCIRDSAWIPLILSILIWVRNAQRNYKMPITFLLMLLMLLEAGSGMMLNYLGMPKYIQPTHLLLATIIFGLGFNLYLRLLRLGRN